jgi:hypothetical protein
VARKRRQGAKTRAPKRKGSASPATGGVSKSAFQRLLPLLQTLSQTTQRLGFSCSLSLCDTCRLRCYSIPSYGRLTPTAMFPSLPSGLVACRIPPSLLHLRRVCDNSMPMSSASSRGKLDKVTRLCGCHLPCLSRSIISVCQIAASRLFRVHSRPLLAGLYICLLCCCFESVSLFLFIPSLYQKVCGRVLGSTGPVRSFLCCLTHCSSFHSSLCAGRSLYYSSTSLSTSNIQHY